MRSDYVGIPIIPRTADRVDYLIRIYFADLLTPKQRGDHPKHSALQETRFLELRQQHVTSDQLVPGKTLSPFME